jgi:hypothetical protein
MIDLTRAFSSAWDRMVIILFQPFDAFKWFILGFNAFLLMLGEGDIQFNKPISFTQHPAPIWTGTSLPAVIHGSKLWLESFRALAEGPMVIWYLFLVVAYIAGWLVLNWVGCRGQFLFLDNIVRNRAAIAWPWQRYACEGNIWFLFDLGLKISTNILLVLSIGLFLLLGWAWISQERYPQGGELATIVIFLIAFILLWAIVGALIFIVRSFTVPLLFRQTFGLGSALVAVLHLLFSRPLSMLAYLLGSLVLAIVSVIFTLAVVCVTCCFIFWLSFIPIIGSLLMTAILAQLLLPLFVYYRCFQVECLSQFGPAYDIWSVDVPPATAPRQ